MTDQPVSPPFLPGIGHPGVKELVHPYVLQNFAADEMREWVEPLVEVVADTLAR